MRIRRILLTLFIISIFLWNGSGNAFAMNTGFSTENMETSDQQYFLNNINLHLLTKEPKKSAITCFDVNNNELVVVGAENSADKTVSVYASDGTFKYGYAFNCYGSIGVEWDDNNIIIYFVRGDVAASFDSNGNIIELRIIEDTLENNSYWNNSVYSTQRIANGNKYAMRNNMGLFNAFAFSYSQLTKTDAEGNIETIYDVSSEQTTMYVIMFIAVIVFVSLVVLIIVSQTMKLRNR